MRHLFELFFNPPPMPPIHLPLPARLIPGVKTTITAVFKAVYERGVFDGFVAGVLVTLVFMPAVRRRIEKGVSDATL